MLAGQGQCRLASNILRSPESDNHMCKFIIIIKYVVECGEGYRRDGVLEEKLKVVHIVFHRRREFFCQEDGQLIFKLWVAAVKDQQVCIDTWKRRRFLVKLSSRVQAVPPRSQEVVGKLFPKPHRSVLHGVPPCEVHAVVPSEQSAAIGLIVTQLEVVLYLT